MFLNQLKRLGFGTLGIYRNQDASLYAGLLTVFCRSSRYITLVREKFFTPKKLSPITNTSRPV